MSDKPETFDSEKNPGLGIALAEVERSTLSHKELLGPPEVYANIYHAISSAYLSGLQMTGRGMLPSDIYALQVIEGLTMQAIRPGSPALLSAARAALVGAGMEIGAGMAAEAAQKAQKAEDDAAWGDKPEANGSGGAYTPKPEMDDAAEVSTVKEGLATKGGPVLDWGPL